MLLIKDSLPMRLVKQVRNPIREKWLMGRPLLAFTGGQRRMATVFDRSGTAEMIKTIVGATQWGLQ